MSDQQPLISGEPTVSIPSTSAPADIEHPSARDLESEFHSEAPLRLLSAFPHPLKHPIKAAAWLVKCAFGLASLIILLAVIAAIPLVNFVALGYLLEAEGRVARTGRLTSAFPLLGLAPRIGSIVLGIAAFLLPLRLLASRAADAALIDPTGDAWNRHSALLGVLVLLVTTHLCLAVARGGTLSCFLRPLKNVFWLLGQLRSGDYWSRAATNVRRFLNSLQLRHHFSLGLRGFVGAFAWLVIPTALFATADRSEGVPILITIFGGLLLLIVFRWLPFLQARFAAEQRLRAMFEVREIRRLFRQAPIAWFVAVLVVFVSSLLLYLAKISLLPQDAMWLVTLIFIVTIYPVRILTGWVYHRALARKSSPWFGWSWIFATAMIPLVGVYVFLLFFTQAIQQHGKAGLFEHHAFLLPVPF